MIDAAQQSLSSNPHNDFAKARNREEETQSGFSFALAAASLEGRAGAALKAFGGTPTNSAAQIDQKPLAQKQLGEDRVSVSSGRETNVEAPQRQLPNEKYNAHRTEAAKDPTVASVSRGNGKSPDASIIRSDVGLHSSVVRTSLAATRANPMAEVSIAREATLRGVEDASRTVRLYGSRATQALPQEFARLLARRLETGATAFDIRLDPPELGKVEARLTIGEEGKATLALKFDNQAAFDLFSRDEAALRLALSSAGFDLFNNDLAFNLAQDGQAATQSIAEPSANDLATLPFVSEPLFIAPFSQGVIDLRV